jgi:beta-fructofuranosidase
VTAPAERPGFHFTAPAGHVNDPLGVTWHEDAGGRGRYELFFQFNPDAPEWAVACRWGQTSSPDLVRWGPAWTALSPAPGEAGCWSGSVAVDDDGVPVIAYTRVEEGSIPVGSVVLATGEPGWRRWTADRDPVLTGPPEQDVVQFRDPFLLRSGQARLMVVGGGRADGTAAAWLYRSPDLRSWRLDGVLAERSGAATEPLWTGTAWECVQLVEVDDAWLLVVSVWDRDPRFVACAVGDFDGSRFTARRWQRLAATDLPYATTTFRDAVGRPCLISWVREPGLRGAGWAGTLSLPWTVRVVDDRLLLAPHPDVATLRTGVAARLDGPGATGPLPPFLDVEVDAPAEGWLELHSTQGPVLVVDLATGTTDLSAPGQDTVRLAVARHAGPAVRLLLDAGLLEVATSAGEYAALRLPATGPVRLVIPEGAGRLRVTAHAMPASADASGERAAIVGDSSDDRSER